MVVFTVWNTVVTAHSGEDTPGFEFHHMPVWGWLLIALVLSSVVYIMYAKTHDKPLNPLYWR